ncbi:hypothetical protein [Paenibacillus sp. BJ-4]|uniref:hypothetical protein n=1 Tax=Paenibacillus sp. BJ-4 TaxID=2878097 RepID=UPI001CF0666F|nr:hypothetical protein [Paenibacillus sp. BJ-4]
MTGEKRDLQKDLEIVTSLVNVNYEPENFIMNEVLPHALKRAIAAESLIQQKDAEIARLTKIINDATDENERLLSGEGTEEYESALTELLKEDTP